MPEQIYGFTGELPTVGYVEYLQVFDAGHGSKTFVVRNQAGVENRLELPPEAVAELKAALG